MELRTLHYFLTIAREETISAAAEVLHVTQPTLSRQMMDLEENLGTKLFIRGNRKIVLTEEGMRLRKRAEEIIDLVHKTEAEFSAPNKFISGDVYVGGGETHGMKFIAKAIHQLQIEYPQITFHLYSGNAEDVTERLDKGLLDFGIVIDPTNLTKYDSLKLPVTDTWGVLMRKDSPLAAYNNISLDMLLNVPLIASRQKLVNNQFSSWFQMDYNKLNLTSTYNLVYNASLLVEASGMYALTLDKLVNTAGESPLCFRPLTPNLEVNIHLIWKKYQVFSKAGEAFLEKIQQLFKEYPH